MLLVRPHFLILISLMLVGCDFSRATETCHGYITAGDTGRYIILDNGIVFDPDTGTEWYRCAFGQRYATQGCSGDALLVTHDELESILAEISTKAGEKWRLPTQGEFQSLRELNCVNPAINTNVFPNPLITNFWVLGEGTRSSKACVVYTYNAGRSCRISRSEPRPFYMVKAT